MSVLVSSELINYDASNPKAQLMRMQDILQGMCLFISSFYSDIEC